MQHLIFTYDDNNAKIAKRGIEKLNCWELNHALRWTVMRYKTLHSQAD
jgi:hypothetical protein